MKKSRFVSLPLAGMLLLLGCVSPLSVGNVDSSPVPMAVSVNPGASDAVVSAAPADPADPDMSGDTVPNFSSDYALEVLPDSLDDTANAYFGESADSAIRRLTPLLVAAAQAAYFIADSYVPANTPDERYAWAIVYQQINEFAESDPALDIRDDGTVILTGKQMLRCFQSDFSAFLPPVPALDTDYGIQYDEPNDSYTVYRSDFADVSYAVVGFRQNEVMSDPQVADLLLMPSDDSEIVDVQIVQNPSSMFGYSIVSITLPE